MKCEIWKVKCSACLKHVINAKNCLICWQFNCKHLLNVSNLGTTWFNFKTPELFFLLDFEQVFYYYFFLVENPCFTFCSSSCYGRLVARKIPRKLICSNSLCNIGRCKSQILMELGYTREIYLKGLRRTVLQKVSFFQLLTKENLLGCFHYLATY